VHEAPKKWGLGMVDHTTLPPQMERPFTQYEPVTSRLCNIDTHTALACVVMFSQFYFFKLLLVFICQCLNVLVCVGAS
jgi:hypothetical protein